MTQSVFHPADQEQGSFLTGLTIGLFAGAAGYFLFATDRGSSMKKRLNHEWQNAQNSWEESGIEAETGLTLRQVFQKIAAEFLNIPELAEKKDDKVRKAAPSRAAHHPAKKPEGKFKGT